MVCLRLDDQRWRAQALMACLFVVNNDSASSIFSWNVFGLNISSRPILVTYVYVTNTWNYIVFWTNNKVKQVVFIVYYCRATSSPFLCDSVDCLANFLRWKCKLIWRTVLPAFLKLKEGSIIVDRCRFQLLIQMLNLSLSLVIDSTGSFGWKQMYCERIWWGN